MKKGFFIKLLFALSILAVAVLYLMTTAKVFPEEYNYMVPNYAACGLAFFWSLLFIIKAFVGNTVIKKLNILVALILAIAGIIILLSTILDQKGFIWPVIAIAVATALCLSIVVTGGKSYDTADNEKVGYKNYRQRKAEEEKRNRKDQ